MENEEAAEMGFCPGVRRAIGIMQRAARGPGKKVDLMLGRGPDEAIAEVMAKLKDVAQ
jgi:hypothetical protein